MAPSKIRASPRKDRTRKARTRKARTRRKTNTRRHMKRRYKRSKRKQHKRISRKNLKPIKLIGGSQRAKPVKKMEKGPESAEDSQRAQPANISNVRSDTSQGDGLGRTYYNIKWTDERGNWVKSHPFTDFRTLRDDLMNALRDDPERLAVLKKLPFPLKEVGFLKNNKYVVSGRHEKLTSFLQGLLHPPALLRPFMSVANPQKAKEAGQEEAEQATPATYNELVAAVAEVKEQISDATAAGEPTNQLEALLAELQQPALLRPFMSVANPQNKKLVVKAWELEQSAENKIYNFLYSEAVFLGPASANFHPFDGNENWEAPYGYAKPVRGGIKADKEGRLPHETQLEELRLERQAAEEQLMKKEEEVAVGRDAMGVTAKVLARREKQKKKREEAAAAAAAQPPAPDLAPEQFIPLTKERAEKAIADQRENRVRKIKDPEKIGKLISTTQSGNVKVRWQGMQFGRHEDEPLTALEIVNPAPPPPPPPPAPSPSPAPAADLGVGMLAGQGSEDADATPAAAAEKDLLAQIRNPGLLRKAEVGQTRPPAAAPSQGTNIANVMEQYRQLVRPSSSGSDSGSDSGAPSPSPAPAADLGVGRAQWAGQTRRPDAAEDLLEQIRDPGVVLRKVKVGQTRPPAAAPSQGTNIADVMKQYERLARSSSLSGADSGSGSWSD